MLNYFTKQPIWVVNQNSTPEKIIQIGIVKTQAVTIFPTMPQLTALGFNVVPTPIIDVEITCVVLKGIPK